MKVSRLITMFLAGTICVSANAYEKHPLSEKFSVYTKDQLNTEKSNETRSKKSVIRKSERITSVFEGNFRFDIFQEYYGETDCAEVIPGWNRWQVDPLTLFPDGKIVLPSSIEYKGKTYKVVAVSEFGNLKGIKEFVIPETMKVIRHEAFERTEIESINIPDGVTELEYCVFRDCRKLEKIHFGKNVAKVSSSVFNGCTALETMEIDEGNTYLEHKDGFLVSKPDMEAMVYYARGRKELVVPAGIEILSEGLCSGVEELEKVTVSEGVKMIGKYVFMDCQNLSEISLPSTLEHLDWSALSNTAIEELIVPDNVVWLADCVDNCRNLKRIRIGKNTSMISKYGSGQSGCGHRIGTNSNNLEEIIVDPENKWFTADGIGLYTKSKSNIGRILPTLRSVDLSGTKITAIGSGAAGHNNNEEIILPEHLKIIDGHPFDGTNLNVPLHIPYTMTHCNWDITFGYKPGDIYYHSNIPHPIIRDDENMNPTGITMHVPAGKKEAFESSHSYAHYTIVDDLPAQKMNCIEFGYNGDRFTNEDRGTVGPPSEGAILIPSEQLKLYEGMQIAGINFDNSFSTDACAFIERLSTGERLAEQEFNPIEQSSMVHIRFDKPYTIQPGDEDILVGVCFNDICNFSQSRMVNPVGNYWRQKGETEWLHGDPSDMTCRPSDHAWMWTVSIEGEKVPVDGRLFNVEVERDENMKVYKVSGFFNNMSDMAVSEAEIAYDFIDTKDVLKARQAFKAKAHNAGGKSIKINVEAAPMRLVPFTAEIPMPESGLFILAMDVAALDGVADALPYNSRIYHQVDGFASVDDLEMSPETIKVARTDGDRLRIEGLEDDTTVEVISLNGVILGTYKATAPAAEIDWPHKYPTIIKVGDYKKIVL